MDEDLVPDADLAPELGTERKRWPLWKILIVVVVLAFVPCVILTGLLATLVAPKVVQGIQTAQESKAKVGIVLITNGVDQYAIENNGRYPDSLAELFTPDENGVTYLGLKTSPRDPWGNEYVYQAPAPGTSDYRVISYGKDGLPGGEGADRDLDNVMIRNGEF